MCNCKCNGRMQSCVRGPASSDWSSKLFSGQGNEKTRLVGRVVQYTQLESIRLWYLRFDKPEIDSWTLFHTVDLDFEGGLKSNRHESYESTEVCGHVLRTRKVHVSLFYGSWLPVGYAGWVENVVDSTRFDRIDTSRFPCCRFVMPEVDLRDASSVRNELRRNVRMESNRQVL